MTQTYYRTQAVGVAFRFEEGIVHKILELDSPGQTVRAESSTGPSEEQSLILSSFTYDMSAEEIADSDRIWIDRKQWEALGALVPDLLGWEAK